MSEDFCAPPVVSDPPPLAVKERVVVAGPVAHTNLVTNPDAETFGAKAVTRTNRATHPAAKAYVTATGTSLGWSNSRWFGPPATGAYSNVTGAADGPTPQITSYARKTWTAGGGSNGDLGFETNLWTGAVAGAIYTVSGWMRSSVARTFVGWEVRVNDVSGLIQRTSIGAGTLAVNTWTRFTYAFTLPPGFVTNVQFLLDTDGGTAPVAGTTIDVAGLLVEQAGAAGAVQRTNLHTNAQVGRNTNGWSVNGQGVTPTMTRETSFTGTSGAPTGVTTAWFKALFASAPLSSPVYVFTCPTGTSGTLVTAGTTYTFSAWVVSTYTGYASVRLDVRWYNAAGAEIKLDTAVDPALSTAGTWERRTKTVVAPALAVYACAQITFYGPTGMPANTYVGVTGVLVEAASSSPVFFDGATVGGISTEFVWTGTPFLSSALAKTPPYPAGPLPYFDGSTPAAGDFVYAWTGGADVSTSTQSADAVVGVSSFQGPWGSRWSSAVERSSGVRSWGVQHLVAAGDVGFIWTITPPAVGVVVTVVARVKAPSGVNYALGLRTSGGASAGAAFGVGTGGWQDITASFTVPSAGFITGAHLILRPPYQIGTIAYVDQVLIVAEATAYPGGWFDGDTLDTDYVQHDWTGTPHASTSTQRPLTVTYTYEDYYELPYGLVPVQPVADPFTTHRASSFSYALLARDGSPKGPLDGVVGGTLTFAYDTRLKVGGKIALRDTGQPIDWLNDRIYIEANVAGVSWGLGVFLPTAPAQAWADGHAGWEVELSSKLLVLDQDQLPVAYSLPAGTVVTAAVRALIVSAGEVAGSITDGPATLAFPMTWEAGTPKLTVINDLLGAAGYFVLQVDGQGAYRALPYVAPSQRAVRYTLVDGASAIYLDSFTRDQDIFKVPNRVIAVQSGSGSTPALVSVAENNDPASPYSYLNRGRWISATFTGVEATDQAALDTYARRQLVDASSPTVTVKVAHGLVPIGPYDAVQFAYGPAGLDARHVVDATDVNLDPTALATSTLRQVVTYSTSSAVSLVGLGGLTL